MQSSAAVTAIHERVLSESARMDLLISEVGKVIVGQKYMVDRILVALLAGGHCLIEGVPGLAKTLVVKTLAQAIDASFGRIQFTPDLLPADVIGTTIYNMHSGEFSKKRGPVFANLVLADEINRAPAKVQAALLEAMEEQQVTIGDETDALPTPFLVLATQNPIEQEGTYALPEAQLDRFMMMIRVGYPSRAEERSILDRMVEVERPCVGTVYDVHQIRSAQATVSAIHMDDSIRDYIVDVVHATREPGAHGLSELEALIENGASPRGSIFLAMAARAHAYLRHRGYVTPQDVKAIGHDVLRHRVTLTYEAQAQEVDSDHVIARIFERVAVP